MQPYLEPVLTILNHSRTSSAPLEPLSQVASEYTAISLLMKIRFLVLWRQETYVFIGQNKVKAPPIANREPSQHCADL